MYIYMMKRKATLKVQRLGIDVVHEAWQTLCGDVTEQRAERKAGGERADRTRERRPAAGSQRS